MDAAWAGGSGVAAVVNNTVVLIGRLTRDAELTELGQDGGSKLRFTLAVDRAGQDAGADFVSCQVLSWRPRADGSTYAANLHEHMVKGKLIAISGRLRIDSQRSELPDAGSRYISYTSVVVAHVQFLDRKGVAASEEPAAEEEGVPF